MFFRKKEDKHKKELTASIKTSGGTLTAYSTEFETEFHEKSEENPNLVHLFSCDRLNLWLNVAEFEVWSSIHNPQIGKQTHWEKLENHDLENLLALGILYSRDFHNPFPRDFYVKKGILRRMSKMLKKIKKKSPE